MAITLDTSAIGSMSGTIGTLALTVAGGANGLIFGVAVQDATPVIGTAKWITSGATQTLTVGVSGTRASSGADSATGLYYLVSPTTGAGSLIHTAPSSTRGAFVLSLNGIDTGSPLDVSGTAGLSGTAGTVSLTTTQGNDWLFSMALFEARIGAYAQIGFGAGETRIGTGIMTISNDGYGASYKPDVASGGNSMITVGTAGTVDLFISSFAIKAAADPGGGPTFQTFKTLLGAGNI